MGNQTFFTKSKILEKAVKPNLQSTDLLFYEQNYLFVNSFMDITLPVLVTNSGFPPVNPSLKNSLLLIAKNNLL